MVDSHITKTRIMFNIMRMRKMTLRRNLMRSSLKMQMVTC